MGFILNSNSVILCPHGGFVGHTPLSGTSYRVDGRQPLLLGDIYQITGCPFDPRYGNSCWKVEWVTGSSLLIVKSRPVLIDSSVGICMSMSGIPQGPAIVAAIRSSQREPETYTFINE